MRFLSHFFSENRMDIALMQLNPLPCAQGRVRVGFSAQAIASPLRSNPLLTSPCPQGEE
jgi:hypothetical protein